VGEMKKIALAVSLVMALFGILTIGDFLITKLAQQQNSRYYQLGYEHGLRSAMHEETMLIPAYTVNLPQDVNYSTFYLERKDGAIPILTLGEGYSGPVTISNCIIISQDSIKDSDKIKNAIYS
jgi:hypothetical protein